MVNLTLLISLIYAVSASRIDLKYYHNLSLIRRNYWPHGYPDWLIEITEKSFYQSWSDLGQNQKWVDPTQKYANMMGRYKRGFYQNFLQKTLLDTYQ